MKKSILWLLAACAFWLVGSVGVLRADIIFLEDGRVIEGEIVGETADEVVVKTASGAELKLESWMVSRVARKEEILKEYEEKRKEVDEKDARTVYELAKWCEKHGLKESYAEHLRAALKLEPGHAEARKELDIIEGRIELPEKPRQLTEEEKEALRKEAGERKKAREEKEKAREEKKKKPYPFGTVTRDNKIPGDMDCKGDCHKLVQGGYMKFDLSSYEPGAKFRSASLKVYVKDVKRNPWLWVCQITADPVKAPAKDLHAEIQSHKILISGAQKINPQGWATIRLNRRAVEAVNDALSRKEGRWFAVSLTFE